jgi:hypothetical protein
MNSRRRLVYYTLVNIFVSALVTGTIIFFYDRAHPANCGGNLPNDSTVSPVAAGVDVSIISVIGPGSLANEQLVIKNNGHDALVLTEWTLKDSKGITYTFPQLTIYPGGTAQIHTGSGTDTASDLYWRRSSPVWESGDLAVLYDSQKIARAFYRIP